MSFTPFDITCYNKLYERFSFLFEEELINDICQNGTLKTFKPHDCIVDIGDKVLQIPLVVSGSIKIMTEDKEGDELLLYYLEVGDTCAITLNCCTRNTRSTVRAIAESELEILFVPVEKMEDWMEKYRSWRSYILESYNSRLAEMVAAIDNLVFSNMEDRLKKYLRDKSIVLKSAELHISHLDIANDLHSSRVVVSRLMKKLENEGVIKQYRNKVIYLEFTNKVN